VAREILIENAMHAIKIASIINRWEYFKSGNFGDGRPLGTVLTIEMLNFLLKSNTYEPVVNKMT
jgi:hypothetical protein